MNRDVNINIMNLIVTWRCQIVTDNRQIYFRIKNISILIYAIFVTTDSRTPIPPTPYLKVPVLKFIDPKQEQLGTRYDKRQLGTMHVSV